MKDSTQVTSPIERANGRKRQKNHRCSDQREQVYNDCEVGTIEQVQLAEVNITSLSAIMVDLDPDLLDPKAFGVKAFRSAEHFFTKAIGPILDRHPVLRKAHARCSGRGLHVLLKLAEPVTFRSPEERERWSAIVRVVQCLLPSDPRCPGITALTRPLGSVNSKNGNKVVELAAGEPIQSSELEALVETCRTTPFRTITSILWDQQDLVPCPICRKPDSQLKVLDLNGHCYTTCGKVYLEQVFGCFFIKTKPTRSTAR